MEAALLEEFRKNNFSVEDGVASQQCAALCVSLGMKPDVFVANWEVFYLNRQLEGGQVSTSDLTGFKQFLVEEQKQALRRQQKNNGFHTYTSNELELLLDHDDTLGQQITPPRMLSTGSKQVNAPENARDKSFDADFALVAPKTPGTTGKSLGKAPRPKPADSPATPFSRRTNKSTIQLVFNEELKEATEDRVMLDSEDDDILRRLPPIQRCEIEILSAYPKAGCRFMNDRVEDRFLALERKIKRFAEVLSASEQRKVSHNVAVAVQEQVIVVGRICCDGDGHLNDKSVLLEGSAEYSGGQRVRLDLQNLSEFSLFPGQVLGVEGHNPSGHCLVASRLIDAVPLSVASHPRVQQEPPSKRRERAFSKPGTMVAAAPQHLTIMVAAGPFSASDNLYFEPLAELFAYARRKRPRLLLLMGPFVDIENSLVKQGLVEKTFKRIFQENVAIQVEDYCREMGDGARVLLIPSCRDAHHDCVFPQPPFKRESLDDPEDQISLAANPCIIRVDEVKLGCCSIDVLRHLSSEEISRTPAEGISCDRMTRVASHIIAQRSFYPLFPPTPGTPLDLSLVPEALSIMEIPDILIMPSDLAPFVKVLSCSSVKCKTSSDESSRASPINSSSSVLCINPGRLTKGLSGGFFSEILLLPESNTAADITYESTISSRCKAVIRRI